MSAPHPTYAGLLVRAFVALSGGQAAGREEYAAIAVDVVRGLIREEFAAATEQTEAVLDRVTRDGAALIAPESGGGSLIEEISALRAEVAGFREDFQLARHGLGPRPAGEDWMLMSIGGVPKRWVRRPPQWGSDEDAPQAKGPSDGRP